MTLTHEDYTVGWVCALPRELAAARGMLDEVHQDLPAESIDCNAYTLGRIGSHNVVLACLPLGETGVVPAAVTVMRMKSTFRCIGIGLVVGVGGGVPSEKHDIRLGDVVVADSGVIQYDMGKTVQGGRFICTQDCQRPPQNLLIAVSKLQSIHRLGEQRIQEYIDKMTSRYPGFLHPGEESDVLYAACYDHPPEEVSCAQCDPIQRVTRAPRQSTHPVVHYGLIASGNQVMRHGATRDKLQREHDVLCFEMEAAGLMREFPSLVIRGICDYSDSHKHKAWQDYAAVTAAAYAKELLSMIPGPLSRPTGKCFMVPFAATPNFVGRNEILALIDDKLQAKEPVVLAGIGGVGYVPPNTTQTFD
jgi:nucleoside phosphorylase